MKTRMSIDINTVMLKKMSVTQADGTEVDYTKRLERELHEAIAIAIVNVVENAQDDIEFDEQVLRSPCSPVSLEIGNDDTVIDDIVKLNIEYSHDSNDRDGDSSSGGGVDSK